MSWFMSLGEVGGYYSHQHELVSTYITPAYLLICSVSQIWRTNVINFLLPLHCLCAHVITIICNKHSFEQTSQASFFLKRGNILWGRRSVWQDMANHDSVLLLCDSWEVYNRGQFSTLMFVRMVVNIYYCSDVKVEYSFVLRCTYESLGKLKKLCT